MFCFQFLQNEQGNDKKGDHIHPEPEVVHEAEGEKARLWCSESNETTKERKTGRSSIAKGNIMYGGCLKLIKFVQRMQTQFLEII